MNLESVDHLCFFTQLFTQQEAVSRLHEEAEVPHTTRKTNESDERTNGEENTSAPTGTKPDIVSRQTVVKSGINKPKSQLSIVAGSIKTKRKRYTPTHYLLQL